MGSGRRWWLNQASHSRMAGSTASRPVQGVRRWIGSALARRRSSICGGPAGPLPYAPRAGCRRDRFLFEGCSLPDEPTGSAGLCRSAAARHRTTVAHGLPLRVKPIEFVRREIRLREGGAARTTSRCGPRTCCCPCRCDSRRPERRTTPPVMRRCRPVGRLPRSEGKAAAASSDPSRSASAPAAHPVCNNPAWTRLPTSPAR